MYFSKYRSNRQFFFAAAVTFLLMSVLFSILYIKRSEEALASRIAPQILRFHVLANSDGEADQQLKLEVKQMLIDTMYGDLRDEAEKNGSPTAPFTKESMSSYILSHREELEKQAEDFMAEQGFPYPAAIRLERCYFPTRVYGDVTFPCGTYDAVRVLLGSGEGKNWWCVLYPALCFTDNAYGRVPDSSRRELANLLDDSDYTALMKNRRVVFGDSRTDTKSGRPEDARAAKPQITVRVRFRLPKLLRGRSD